MRLLNTKSRSLEFFPGDEVPPYAALSHTWGSDEISLKNYRQSKSIPFKGTGTAWEKIRRSCEVAASLGLGYIWIDTCCIDKASSAELSEAINSMFRWYAQSQICIAYLADVDSIELDTEAGKDGFRQSRWFTRGWTLQELVAPSKVSFYNKSWAPLGSRESCWSLINDLTNIPQKVLENKHGYGRVFDELSVAERMNWAAKRRTTRSEDMAYCLLGLFDINMPLLYGEGLKKAFRRLQEEIIKSTDDDSIYYWRCLNEEKSNRPFWGLLAETPQAFGHYKYAMCPKQPKYLTRTSINATTVSSRGIHTELAMAPLPNDTTGTLFIAFLDCEVADEEGRLVNPIIFLQKMSAEFVRVRPDLAIDSQMRRITRSSETIIIMKFGNQRSWTSYTDRSPRQVFVPHEYKTPRHPSGIIFYYKIPNSSLQFRDTLGSASASASWSFSSSWSISEQSLQCEIDFDRNPLPSAKMLSEPMVIGALPLRVQGFTGKSWNTRLVLGLDPLGPTCVGTPPTFYFSPWCSFTPFLAEGEQDATHIEACKTNRLDTIVMYSPVRASIRQERVQSRLMYRVSLDYLRDLRQS